MSVVSKQTIMNRLSARQRLDGVTFYSYSEAHTGYTLITPVSTPAIWLINMAGAIVKQWDLPFLPSCDAKFLENGNILVNGKDGHSPLKEFEGAGGILQERTPDNRVVWEYRDPLMHHRCHKLDSGNVLIITWAEVPPEIAENVKGGFPGNSDTMWGDIVQEIDPNGEIIWEWKSYEYLDPEHDQINRLHSRDQWTHATSVEAMGDEKILISFMHINQVVVVNKQTGQIEWKWGKEQLNQQNFATATPEGNILIFDNGHHIFGESRGYSRPIEVNVETNNIVGGYEEDPETFFFSCFLGNAQKLPNGNTLMVEGVKGRLLEVSHKNCMAWEYVNPFWAEDEKWGINNYISSAYRHGLEDVGLATCLGLRKKWKLWSEANQAERPQSAAAPVDDMELAIKNRLANLGY